MLTKRIIPCLDVLGSRVVKGTRFVGLRDAGDPVALAERYASQGADELFFLDITASAERRGILLDLVRAVAEAIFIPFGVGGGLRTLADIRGVLAAGAEKVSLNTAAVENPGLIREAAREFGSQAVVVAVDVRRREPHGFEVVTHGGRRPTGLDALAWVRAAVEAGAGELLVTSMDCDGVRSGYDLELIRAVSDAVHVPVIASGGAGGVEDIRAVLVEGRADAALAASIFHLDGLPVTAVKAALAASGVCVRPVRPSRFSPGVSSTEAPRC